MNHRLRHRFHAALTLLVMAVSFAVLTAVADVTAVAGLLYAGAASIVTIMGRVL